MHRDYVSAAADPLTVYWQRPRNSCGYKHTEAGEIG